MNRRLEVKVSMSDARANPLLDGSVQLSPEAVPGPLRDEAKLPVPSLAPTTTPGERVDAISCPGYLFWLLLLLLLYNTFDYGLAEGWWLVAWALWIVWKLLRPTKTLVRMCMAKDCRFSRPPSTADDAIDPEAAFPTAQFVAAMRSNDAELRFPKIGSNVGAGPYIYISDRYIYISDIYARALAGEKGKDYLADILAWPLAAIRNPNTKVTRVPWLREPSSSMGISWKRSTRGISGRS